MDFAIPRNRIVSPTELSRLASRREPDSLQHLYKFTRQGQDFSNQYANITGQLARGLNRALAPKPLAPGHMHPFKIYQLPSQFRNTVGENDWLKFRCRNGLVTFRPTVVPTSLVGTPTDDWTYGATQCGFFNPPDPSQAGVDVVKEAAGYGGNCRLPFTGDSEVFLPNGGDPDYEMVLPPVLNEDSYSVGLFWIDLSQDPSDDFPSPQIKFGGQWIYDPGGFVTGTFGETIPVYLTGGIDGWQYSQTSILGNFIVLGMIVISGTAATNQPGTTFVPYIDQRVYGHLIDIPNNYVNVAGQYSENTIYWTGDVVTNVIPDSPPASGMPFYSGYIQMQNYADPGDGAFTTDTRFARPWGVSGIAPPTDGTFNSTWLPWITGIVP